MADEVETTTTTTPTPATAGDQPGKTDPPPPPPTSEDVDPDAAELDAALKEVEAEGKAAETPAAAQTETPPASTETPAASPGPAAGEPPTVPVAALQEERRKRQEAEEALRKSVSTALYYKGVADGRLPIPQRTEDDQPKPDRAKEIRAAQRELGKQVDAGTLSTEEYELQRQALDDELLEIRESRLLEKVQKVAPKAEHDLYLDEKTEKLETENPWVKKIPDDEIQLLIPFARKELQKTGFDLASVAGTPVGDFKLREALIAVAKRQGFDKMYGGDPAASAGTPAPGAVTARPTEADRKEKEALAAIAPPTPVGTTAPATTWTQDRVEQMDSLDLENMSMADLKRIGDVMDREAATARTHTTVRR